MSDKLYHDAIAAFENVRIAKEGQAMSKYMRNLFPYYGVKSPLRKTILKEVLRTHSIPHGEDLKGMIDQMWEHPEREMQYLAIDIMLKVIKKQPSSFLDYIEKLILQKSWWDTVDWLAGRGVGTILMKNTELIPEYSERWISDANIWLQRTALIFQLFFKEKTDFERMKKYVLQRSDATDFFVKKGAGWALRQYSKTNGDAVVQFVADNPQLSHLTKTEALKWLKNQNRSEN